MSVKRYELSEAQWAKVALLLPTAKTTVLLV